MARRPRTPVGNRCHTEITDQLRRPLDDRIYFVNQDNWALPAVENCLLDAEIYVPQIEAGL